jgi:hypothetical protein
VTSRGNERKDIFYEVESGVSQACRRVEDKIRKDKKLERKISMIEKKINVSGMKTMTPLFFSWHATSLPHHKQMKKETPNFNPVCPVPLCLFFFGRAVCRARKPGCDICQLNDLCLCRT